MILMGFITITAIVNIISSYADIQTYKMEEHCDTMIHMIMDSVYQIRLQLDDIYIHSQQSARPVTCQTKIEPWYTWPNLMFYFENLDLDCEHGYLQFFQSTNNSTRIKGLENDICGGVKPEGVFLLDKARYLQIRYVAKRNQYVEDVFSVIITSYTKEPCPDHSFKCENSRCIDREIRCDGYDSCGDGSGCRFDLSSAAMSAIIICSLVGLFVLISTAVCVFCCVKKSRKSRSRAQNHAQPWLVYTVTADGNETLGPPSYISGQNGQISSSNLNSINPALHLSATASSSLSRTNFTAAQNPAYPPNFTMPSCQEDIFENPPPYEEMQTSEQERIDSTTFEQENTNNEVLDNVNSTDISMNEVTCAKKAENTFEESKELKCDDIENNTEYEDCEQNGASTFESINNAAVFPETRDSSVSYMKSKESSTYKQKEFNEETKDMVVHSYANPLYSEENHVYENKGDTLEMGPKEIDTGEKLQNETTK